MFAGDEVGFDHDSENLGTGRGGGKLEGDVFRYEDLTFVLLLRVSVRAFLRRRGDGIDFEEVSR